MEKLFRFLDWPLRAKMAALLVVASVLPLAIAAIIDIRQAGQRLVVNTSDLLAARGDQLVDQLDTFHRSYQRSVEKFTRLPLIFQFCRASPDDAERLKPTLGGVFEAHLGTDSNVWAVMILDMSGTVRAATEANLIGKNLSNRSHVRAALRGASITSDIHMAESQGGSAPAIAYLAPVLGTNGEPVAIAMYWVRASALWGIMKKANELAGPNSFAVLFDHQGIRVGHTYSDDIVFHPGGRLDPATVTALVTERRFGEKTRQLLEDLRVFPEQFDRARSASPDRGVFRGVAPVNQKWNYGVARRLETVPWTLFYMIPEQSLNAQIARMTRQKTLFASAIILVALVAGTLFAVVILKPIRSLSEATRSIADGNLAARVQAERADEVGRLGASFNVMAGRIETQAIALQRARDDLEIRVQERTAELVQTTKDLRASEEHTRKIIETALDAVVTMDSAGLITGWSPQAETAFGWTRQEALGRSLADTIIPESYRQAHQRGLQHFLKTGEGPVLNKRVELTALHRDGHEFAVELSITPIRTDGNVTFSAFVRDITERKRAEEAVRQSEARYRTLFDTLIEGFCTIEMIFDADGKPVDYRFLEINPAFEKQTGLHNAQGRLMRDLAPDHEAHWFEIYGKIALTGEPVHFENEAKALGRHYDVFAYRVGGPESRKVAILFNDITERKLAGIKLQAQLGRLNLLHQITRATGERQDLQSIFQVVIRRLEDDLPVDFSCVCIYDQPAHVLKVVRVGVKSAPTAMELAMTEQAVIPIDENGLSRCVRGELVYEPDISQVKFPFPQRLASGGLRSLVAAPLLVESQVFGVLVAARRQPQSFSSGECEFLKQLSEHVALASHQAQLHGALKAAYDDLRQSQQAVMQQERLRALGQMASGIAHDINNAISPMSLYTQSLLEQEPNLSARARDYLVTIGRGIDDVAATVARMREFYRQREPQLTLTSVQLNDLMEQVMRLTRARWNDMPQQRGIVVKLATDLAPDLPVIMGVESEIREALTNLIFNAVDAMPEGGTLTLRTRVSENVESPAYDSDSRTVCVEVTDTGAGMDEDTRRRCLEPFFTTKGERGTGLGLAMVYGMVQRHSAEIEIESAVGKGTTVRLSFTVPKTPLPGSSQPPGAYAVPSRLRILIVDDDPLLLKSLRDTLETDGHVIVTANGGQEGIDTFRAARDGKESFAVVITDLGMPYVDGRKVASVVKGLSPSTPVIMLTGWGQRLVAEGDVPPQVDRVLNKPPKLRDLREALARCCQSTNL